MRNSDLIYLLQGYENGEYQYRRREGRWGYFLSESSKRISPPPVIRFDAEVEAFHKLIAVDTRNSSTHHLVLADFLRERGREVEGNWHQAFGEWLQNHYPDAKGSKEWSVRISGGAVPFPAGLALSDILGYRNQFKFSYQNRESGDLLPEYRKRRGEAELVWPGYYEMTHSLYFSFLIKYHSTTPAEPLHHANCNDLEGTVSRN